MLRRTRGDRTMQYQAIRQGRFLRRPNRFIAHVALDGGEVVCHVKNTGRCRELLTPGAVVYLETACHPGRKTNFDLIGVEKPGEPEPLLVNMDAQAPNRVFQEWAQAGGFLPGLTYLKPEQRWGNSRFDFYFEAGARRGFVEVKGVTLESGGHARFPDAPTERGVKHIEELIACRREGFEAYLCFVLQMAGMRDFSPNDETHPAFGEALRSAAKSGVEVLARECRVTPDTLEITGAVPILL